MQVKHPHEDSPQINNTLQVQNSTSHFEANNRELTANRTPIENSRKSEMLNAKIMTQFWRGADY